jgi:alcohol dehydrogenase class IV
MTFYTFAMHTAVSFGAGSLQRLPQTVQDLGGHRVLIVTDPGVSKAGIPQRVQALLPGSMLFDGVQPDPAIDHVTAALDALRESAADLLIAVGGGSSIDTAKLAAMLAANGGDLLDYAADWSRVRKQGLPLIAIPTTVGSGSEMTRGAVFANPETGSKLVVVSPHLAPRVALLDPTLLETLPSAVTASTGADALTQAIEGILSMAANPYTDALHLQAIRLIRDALRLAVANSADTQAMGRMQQAAAMVGAGLAYSGVGAAHAIANTLGGHYHIPHGIACAVMLKPVLRFNAGAVPARYRPIAEALGLQTRGLSAAQVADAVVAAVSSLLDDIGVSWRLRQFDIPHEALGTIAREAQVHSDMGSNPRQPTVAEVAALLEEVW